MVYILRREKYLREGSNMQNYIAIGDMVMDVYLDSNLKPLGYYSGGSIWNDLINIKSRSKEANCYGIGTCGNDLAGNLVMDVLSQHGVDLRNVWRISKQTNRFNIIVNYEKTKCQKMCPICKQSIWYSETRYPTSIPEQLKEIEPGIVIVDCLRQSILGLAQEFREHSWYIAADIGYISHLRYLSAANIRTLFIGRFDFLQLNNRVYRFLSNKLALSNEKELFELFACRYMSITNGSEGAKLLFSDKSGKTVCISMSAKSATVIDVTGAGDMFFSSLLLCLNKNGYLEGSKDKILDFALENTAERISVVGALGMLKQVEMPDGGCHVCGSTAKLTKGSKPRRQRIETNTNHLLDRILRSLESGASKQVKEILDNIEGMIYMVGTGGSFVSACYAAKIVNSFQKSSNAVACHPRDIVINRLGKVNAVFLFSYSGSTKDILNIYNLCKANKIPVYLVTKKRGSDLSDLNSNAIISYSNSNSDAKERGFLSIAGTLIPMCIFAEAYYDCSKNSFKEFLKKCFSSRCEEFSKDVGIEKGIFVGVTVDVFYGADTDCAALDVESKFIESGVGRIVLHEKKDFSHGRFNILEKMPPDFIIYFENQQGHYSKKLKEYLERRNIPTVYLKTQYLDLWGQLDLMIATQYFLKAISKHINYDMSKPDYPKDAMALYRYSGKDLL